MRKLPIELRGGIWHFKGTVNGVRIRMSLQTSDRSVAVKHAKAILRGESPLERSVHSPVAPRATVDVATRLKGIGLSVKDALDAGWRTHWSTMKDDDVKYRIETVKLILGGGADAKRTERDPFVAKGGARLLSEITTEDLALFKLKYSDGEGNISPTLNRVLSPLHYVMKLALDEDKITRMPKFPRAKERRPERVPFSDADVLRLLDAETTGSTHQMQTLWTFLLATGARRGEAQKLQWRDVDFRAGTVRFENTKSGETRTVPLTRIPALIEELALLKATEIKRPFDLTDTQMYWAWVKVKRALKLADVYCIHSMRHTCASQLLAEGMDVRKVQAWLGHETLAMTVRYTKVTTAQLLGHVADVAKKNAQADDRTTGGPVHDSSKAKELAQ